MFKLGRRSRRKTGESPSPSSTNEDPDHRNVVHLPYGRDGNAQVKVTLRRNNTITSSADSASSGVNEALARNMSRRACSDRRQRQRSGSGRYGSFTDNPSPSPGPSLHGQGTSSKNHCKSPNREGERPYQVEKQSLSPMRRSKDSIPSKQVVQEPCIGWNDEVTPSEETCDETRAIEIADRIKRMVRDHKLEKAKTTSAGCGGKQANIMMSQVSPLSGRDSAPLQEPLDESCRTVENEFMQTTCNRNNTSQQAHDMPSHEVVASSEETCDEKRAETIAHEIIRLVRDHHFEHVVSTALKENHNRSQEAFPDEQKVSCTKQDYKAAKIASQAPKPIPAPSKREPCNEGFIQSSKNKASHADEMAPSKEACEGKYSKEFVDEIKRFKELHSALQYENSRSDQQTKSTNLEDSVRTPEASVNEEKALHTGNTKVSPTCPISIWQEEKNPVIDNISDCALPIQPKAAEVTPSWSKSVLGFRKDERIGRQVITPLLSGDEMSVMSEITLEPLGISRSNPPPPPRRKQVFSNSQIASPITNKQVPPPPPPSCRSTSRPTCSKVAGSIQTPSPPPRRRVPAKVPTLKNLPPPLAPVGEEPSEFHASSPSMLASCPNILNDQCSPADVTKSLPTSEQSHSRPPPPPPPRTACKASDSAKPPLSPRKKKSSDFSMACPDMNVKSSNTDHLEEQICQSPVAEGGKSLSTFKYYYRPSSKQVGRNDI